MQPTRSKRSRRPAGDLPASDPATGHSPENLGNFLFRPLMGNTRAPGLGKPKQGSHPRHPSHLTYLSIFVTKSHPSLFYVLALRRRPNVS